MLRPLYKHKSAFSVVKYRNGPPASVVTAPTVNVFKKRLQKVWKKAFPISPIDWTLISSIPYSPVPSAHLIYSYHLYILPNSLFLPTFYHYKSLS